jgi:SAM-dependent methyltransferase
MSAQPELLYEAQPYQLGEIVRQYDVDPSDLGIRADLLPRSITGVEVRDPYVEQYSPEDIQEVKTHEQAANDFAQARRMAGKWERKPGTAYYDSDDKKQETKRGFGDPVSRDKFFNQELGSPAINAWRTKIPSAEALADLSDPLNRTVITDKNGNIVPMDETGRKWLSLCTDAVGIRSRATVMAEVVRKFSAEQFALGASDRTDFRWLSVACGTALPSMQGAIAAGVNPDLLLVDFDQNAMAATERLKEEIGYQGRIVRPAQEVVGKDGINIFDPMEMGKLKDYLGDNGGRPKLIDLMGIFEYTGENLGVDSAQFLKTCYDMLAPGGKLVFGQMRADREVQDFTMGVVSWPFVEMRSPGEFMQIIADAGIRTDSVDLYLPSDKVYTVGVISKPLEEAKNLAKAA